MMSSRQPRVFAWWWLLVLFGLTACRTPVPDGYDPLVVRIFLEAHDSESGLSIRLPLTGTVLSVREKAVFSETDIVNAEVVQVDLGKCLLLQLSSSAARDLYRLTVSNQGRRLVVVANDQPLGVRLIDRGLDEGNILVFLEVADDELPEIVRRVKETSNFVQKELKRKG